MFAITIPYLSSIVLALIISFFISYRLKKIFTKKLQHIAKSMTGLIGLTTQLKNSNSDISQSSLDQSAAIQESAAASDEIFSMAKNNQEKTASIAQKVSDTLSGTIRGRDFISALNELIEDINQSNRKLTQQIENSNNRFSDILNILSDIGQKTSVIHEIVFQTKLLSFNASVEAARAGEHGKGFAVVAQEIGNLANMSGKSAQEIEAIINDSTLKVKEILAESEKRSQEIIEESLQTIKLGLEKSDDTKTAFEQIAEQIESVSSDIHSVTEATLEQTKGVEEISHALNHLSEITQRNSLISQQITQSVSILSSMISEFDSEILQLLNQYSSGSSNQKIDQIPWGTQYHIGVEAMDKEHEILIKKINILIEAMNTDNFTIIERDFSDLLDYVVEHFEDEELFLQEINYPQYASHKKIHENLVNNMRDFGKKISERDLDKRELSSFLQNWLITHILGVDMKYADFFNKDSGIEKIA